MTRNRTAFDQLKLIARLWRVEGNATDARSGIDELVREYPDSEEARTALELLAEIDGTGATTKNNRRDWDGQQIKATPTNFFGIPSRLSTLIEGIGAILIAAWLIRQGMEPGASIMLILGLPVLLAGVVMTIVGFFKMIR